MTGPKLPAAACAATALLAAVAIRAETWTALGLAAVIGLCAAPWLTWRVWLAAVASVTAAAVVVVVAT